MILNTKNTTWISFNTERHMQGSMASSSVCELRKNKWLSHGQPGCNFWLSIITFVVHTLWRWGLARNWWLSTRIFNHYYFLLVQHLFWLCGWTHSHYFAYAGDPGININGISLGSDLECKEFVFRWEFDFHLRPDQIIMTLSSPWFLSIFSLPSQKAWDLRLKSIIFVWCMNNPNPTTLLSAKQNNTTWIMTYTRRQYKEWWQHGVNL